MKLTCKKCGSQILASGIDINSLMAKCGSCNSTFSFEDKFSSEKQDSRFDTKSTNTIPLPDNFKVNETGGTFTMEMRWFQKSLIFVAIFLVLWITMFLGFVSEIDFGMFSVIFFIPGVIVSIVIYFLLAGLFNKTIITINQQNFTIKIGPLPWRGNKNLNTSDITQLYVKSILKTPNKGPNYFLYSLYVILKDRTHLCLIKSLNESQQALYFEQKIEEFLKIEDERVRGETKHTMESKTRVVNA